MPGQDERNPAEPLPSRKNREESSERIASIEQRKRRADEYERQGLQYPNAFDACLAAIQADQIRIGFALGEAVKKELGRGNVAPETLGQLEPSLNMYLRVTRQIERYRQLEIRHAEVQREARKTQRAEPSVPNSDARPNKAR
jgi:hypothetical protein